MERFEYKQILEALLFVTDRPVSVREFADILEQPEELVQELLQELRLEIESRHSAIELKEVANGFQFATKPVFTSWIQKLFKDRLTYRLSTSAIETLSIIAYKQPITRSEIEEIRGVEVTAVLETLLERKLVRIVGRKETVGRPLLYGTTLEFLKAFNLRRLADLPAIENMIPPAELPEISNVEDLTSSSLEPVEPAPEQTNA